MQEFKYEYKQINSKYILSGLYQRSIDTSKVKKIVANFNPNLVNPVKVSFRENSYWVFDGQHTLRALVLRNGGTDLMVDCKVYYGMTYEDEARMFALQNGIQTAVQSIQQLRSLYEAKDVNVLGFKETVEATGIKCDFVKTSDTPFRISCYGGLYKIYRNKGAQHTLDLLTTIIEIWGGEASSLRGEIINGMDIFMTVYNLEYNRKILVSKLSRVSPISIIRDGRISPTGGNKRFAKMILAQYNKNASTNKLEDKI